MNTLKVGDTVPTYTEITSGIGRYIMGLSGDDWLVWARDVDTILGVHKTLESARAHMYRWDEADGESKKHVVGNRVGDIVHPVLVADDAKGRYCTGYSSGYWLVWERSTGLIRSRHDSRSLARSFMFALAEKENFVGAYKGESVFTRLPDPGIDELTRCKAIARNAKEYVETHPEVSDRLKLAVVLFEINEILGWEKS